MAIPYSQNCSVYLKLFYLYFLTRLLRVWVCASVDLNRGLAGHRGNAIEVRSSRATGHQRFLCMKSWHGYRTEPTSICFCRWKPSCAPYWKRREARTLGFGMTEDWRTSRPLVKVIHASVPPLLSPYTVVLQHDRLQAQCT